MHLLQHGGNAARKQVAARHQAIAMLARVLEDFRHVDRPARADMERMRGVEEAFLGSAREGRRRVVALGRVGIGVGVDME